MFMVDILCYLDVKCQTDSRLREDLKLLENGDVFLKLNRSMELC